MKRVIVWTDLTPQLPSSVGKMDQVFFSSLCIGEELGVKSRRSLLLSLILVALLSVVLVALPSVAGVAVAGENVWTSNGPEGGTIRSLAIDPKNTQTIYAGTYGGGVFKSTNGGNAWTVVNSGLKETMGIQELPPHVYALAIDPTSSQTVYAGAYRGGVFKSTNGGKTWTAVNSGLTNTNVWALAIDPVNSQTVYTGTEGGVFKSTDGGGSWAAVNSGNAPRSLSSVTPTSNKTATSSSTAQKNKFSYWVPYVDTEHRGSNQTDNYLAIYAFEDSTFTEADTENFYLNAGGYRTIERPLLRDGLRVTGTLSSLV